MTVPQPGDRNGALARDPTGGVRLRFEWERRLRDDPEARGAHMGVLLVMATHYNRRTERICVARSKVAAQAGVAEKTVTRAVEWALKRGWLHREWQGRGVGRNSQGRASVYQLQMPLDVVSAGHISGTSPDFSGTSGEFQRDIAERGADVSAGHSRASAERGQSTGFSETDIRKRDRAAALSLRPPRWPAWCGDPACDPRSSQVLDEEKDPVGRCPLCHPAVVGMPKRRRSA